jgi:hypothetical protein
MQFRFPQFVPTPLSQLITNASPEGIALMQVIPLTARVIVFVSVFLLV